MNATVFEFGRRRGHGDATLLRAFRPFRDYVWFNNPWAPQRAKRDRATFAAGYRLGRTQYRAGVPMTRWS